MRFLITGGAGFIGSHLCDLLLAEGHHVSVIDNLSSGTAANLSHLRDHNLLSVTLGSVFDTRLMADLVDQADLVVHLAATVGVKLVIQSPIRTLETNALGTELLLQLASEKGKKVVLASSSEVYGKATKVPLSEEDDLVVGSVVRQRWSYACSKMLGEFLALAYFRERLTPVVITRLFNTVGPRQIGGYYGMVVSRLVQQALSNDPMTVYGDGGQRRCFSYVGDVVRGIYELSLEPSAVGEIFNLGNDQEMTINELALLVLEVTHSSSPIIHIPYEDAYDSGFEEVHRRVPDLRKVRQLIDYKPTVGIREIVESVAGYFKDEEVRHREHECPAPREMIESPLRNTREPK